jgi:Zn-dependent protease
MDDLTRVVVGIGVLIFSCVFHECAHVWMAWKLGDPTGKALGRLTLNPIPHIDLFWTILLPGLMALTGGLIFGGPKPAPVNSANFRDPRWGTVVVAMAGPISNLLLALGGALLLWLAYRVAPSWVQPESYNAYALLSLMITNVALAALNLIPLPPLDGSRVLHYLLGPAYDRLFATLEIFSLLIIMGAFSLLGPSVFGPALQGLGLLLENLFDHVYLDRLIRTYWKL